MVRRALISVSDKAGIVDLAQRLHARGVEIISTGGTASALLSAGIPVTAISDVTGFPEIMDGRVKTLHPNVHGALLARRDVRSHMETLEKHAILPIDMVVVNLYPFRQTIRKQSVTLEDAIENIDIGGPSMIRSAAKNHKDVLVLVNPARYEQVLQYIERGEPVPYDVRFGLACEAFHYTAAYDALISAYFRRMAQDGPTLAFAENLLLWYEKKMDLRYGENPHQRAALYSDPFASGPSVTAAEQLHGKELSYNNIVDADAALSLVLEFNEPCAVAVKHANPCGVATGASIFEAYEGAFHADPVSIFGGIVALNRPVSKKTAEMMSEIFLEIVLAPGYEPEAFGILAKKKNIRLLRYNPGTTEDRFEIKKVAGGLLLQDADLLPESTGGWRVVTKRSPSALEMADLGFAWKVVKYVKSNAILLAKAKRTTGIGPGQPNRIDSARIAITRAGQNAAGSVLASDAMMPFPDVVEAARDAGITAVIQPGGSIRDDESIARANEAGIAMVFTGTRHFRH